MKTVVMVAEKPSLAQSIAKILSRGSASQRKGFSSACAIHEYNSKFFNESARFKVTSVCGHVMSLDFGAKYNNWEKVDPAELFQAPVYKKEANPKLNIPKHLEKECKGADAIVLWLDCDKEGENICFEVLDIVLPVLKRKSIYRAHFSAITDKDINYAMNNLGSPDENQSLCVDARQELDLRLGCAFTRFQTKFFQGKYGDLDSSLISYGPCQTPTLGFCVDRHDFIQSFKPENFWVVDVTVKTSTNSSIKLEWGRDRLFDRDAAQVFLVLVQQNKQAEVLNVKTSDKVKQRPQALNTVEMLRIASSGLNIGPQQTMQIAERLYTQGYISYPRTETTQYPENFDFKSVLNSNRNHKNWGEYVSKLLSDGYNKPRKGKDVGDHPPITPMRSATESEVGPDAWRLYDYICRHFFASLSSDCVYKQTKVQFKIGNELFFCNGVSPHKPGFTDVMPWKSIDEFQTLPTFTTGEKCAIEHSQLTEKHTNPPDYLTESEVITLMEKHGIGTDASIPTHINNICQRNYVTVASGRKLVPTILGIVLVHGYRKVDQELVLPTMRAAVEKQLDLIAVGKAKQVDVLKHALDIFRQKFHYFVSHVTAVDQLFEVSFSPLSESGRAISRCGKCRRFLKLITAAPTRLYCKTCDETYALPQKTSMKLYKELKCPLDDFELLLCTTGNKGKAYPLCPYCYNNPPFAGMTKNSGCNACTHPTCIHSMSKLGIARCVSCETGVLILDHSMPPRWRLICNNSICTTVILISLDVAKIKVTETQCDQNNCDAYNVNVEVKDHQNETKSGCLFCNPDLSGYLELKKARMTVARPKSGRGRGRGRGSGGRGRKRQPKDKMSQLANYFV